MQVDLVADDILFRRLRECGAVEMASSEEKPDEIHLGGKGFSVRSVLGLSKVLVALLQVRAVTSNMMHTFGLTGCL